MINNECCFILLSCCDWNSSSLDCGSVLCLNVSIHPRAQVVDSMNKDLGYHTVYIRQEQPFSQSQFMAGLHNAICQATCQREAKNVCHNDRVFDIVMIFAKTV